MTTAPAPRPVTPLGILTQRLQGLSTAIDVAETVPREIVDEARALVTLAAGLDPYVAAMSTPEPAHLARVGARTAQRDWTAAAGRAALGLEQEMISGHVEGRLLALLARAVRARTVLEIGTFTGYATLALAAALPADGCVVTCEIDDEVAALAAASFADAPGAAVDLRVGPALDTLDALVRDGRRFDLIFLDADKAGYVGYVRRLLDGRLLADDGLLCVDNTLMQGEPWTGEVSPNGRAVARFNEYVADEPRLEQVLVPVRDGVTLALWAPGARPTGDGGVDA